MIWGRKFLMNRLREKACIKMNRRSLVSLKLKNGLTDLNIYFFLLFALIQGWFKKKKKLEKLPGKLENSGKIKSAFFYGNGWNDLANFFFNVRNNPYEVFM
jgi:hypothetical protein